jgi:hypothetical protein
MWLAWTSGPRQEQRKFTLFLAWISILGSCIIALGIIHSSILSQLRLRQEGKSTKRPSFKAAQTRLPVKFGVPSGRAGGRERVTVLPAPHWSHSLCPVNSPGSRAGTLLLIVASELTESGGPVLRQGKGVWGGGACRYDYVLHWLKGGSRQGRRGGDYKGGLPAPGCQLPEELVNGCWRKKSRPHTRRRVAVAGPRARAGYYEPPWYQAWGPLNK